MVANVKRKFSVFGLYYQEKYRTDYENVVSFFSTPLQCSCWRFQRRLLVTGASISVAVIPKNFREVSTQKLSNVKDMVKLIHTPAVTMFFGRQW